MGERKGTNKYYPPDFDPKKHRSLDAYHGTHALRERARKLHEGILIIRFEMPYNIWCEGCKNHIGMGVRYNAEKSKIGMYYTTPIYKFRMKCHLCDNHFEIKTDPANHDYVIIEGARRKEQRWDPKENEQIVTEDKNDQKKMATDAMFKMEHGVEDKNKSKKAMPGISQLTAVREQWKDDYELNKIIRNQFREKKKLLKTEAEKDQALLNKSSLDIKLVPEDSSDKKMAELLKYRTVISFQEKQKQKRDEILKRSIFASPSQVTSPAATPSSSSGSSDSSEGSVSKTRLKRKEAYKLLTKIATKHTSPFSSENANAKVAKIGEENTIRQLGIVHRHKTGNCIQKVSQQGLGETQRTKDGSNFKHANKTQSIGDVETTSKMECIGETSTTCNIQSMSDAHRTTSNKLTTNDNQRICDILDASDREGTSLNDSLNISQQESSVEDVQDSNKNKTENDTKKSMESSDNFSVNALKNLMSTYTDSSGESD